MRFALTILVLAPVAALPFTMNDTLRIDHVAVAGSKLADLQAKLELDGIHSEVGGVHAGGGTEMAVASFPDGSYVELIARAPNAGDKEFHDDPWAKYMEGNAGPCAWAVRPKDFDGEVARVRASGIPAAVNEGGRKRPDGFELRWKTASVGSDPLGTFFPFFIADATPRDKRAYLNGKPANRDESGVLRVVIAVRSLKNAVERFQTAFPGGHALKEIDARFGAELAWIPDTPVVFAAPLGSSNQVAQRLEKFGEGPCGYLLSQRKELKHGSGPRSRWFGRDVAWFDPEQLGWWLGVQQEM